MPKLASNKEMAMVLNLERLPYRVLKSQWGTKSRIGWDRRAMIKPVTGVGAWVAIIAPAMAWEAASMRYYGNIN